MILYQVPLALTAEPQLPVAATTAARQRAFPMELLLLWHAVSDSSLNVLKAASPNERAEAFETEILT